MPPSPHEPVAPPAPVRPSPARQWVSAAVVAGLTWGAYQGWNAWRQDRVAEAVRQNARNGDIVMYTTNDCPYCAAARRWLDGHGVPWRECNIDRDAACMAVFQAKGGPGVPLVQARGQWQLGFNALWLAEVIGAPR